MFVESEDWAKDLVETKSFEFMGSKLKNYELELDSPNYFENVNIVCSSLLNKSLKMYESFISEMK